MCEIQSYLVLHFIENKKIKSSKEIMINGKQHPQYNNCTNTDNAISNVPVISATNHIGSQQKLNLPTA